METSRDLPLELDAGDLLYEPGTFKDSEKDEDFVDISAEPSGATTFPHSSIFQPGTEEFLDIDCLSEQSSPNTGGFFDPIDQSPFNESQATLEGDLQFLSQDYPSQSSQESMTPEVIDHIENYVLGFLQAVLDALPRQAGSNPSRCSLESDNSVQSSPNEEGKLLEPRRKKIELALADRRRETFQEDAQSVKYLHYPRKATQGSLKPFAQVFRLLEISHRATIACMPTTKRDVFYQDVSLFGSQKVVDTFVDDLAATFDVERSELHIRSSSKGLVCGSSIRIKLLSGEEIECKDSESTLIPAGEDVETFSIDEKLAWVLVVEKEAVFQTLVKLGVTTREIMPGEGIIITGKGYPDVSTRHLVKSLADALPRRIPICCLVDADPYGIDILSVYKFGSRAMRHENDRLAANRIRWLGVCASELAAYGVDRESLLPLSQRDQRKIISLLKRSDNPLPKKWKKELQHMLFIRRKAEIEVLCSNTPPLDGNSQAAAVSESFQAVERRTSCPRDCYALLLEYISQRLRHLIDRRKEQREDAELQPLLGGLGLVVTPSRPDACDELFEQDLIWDTEGDCDVETDLNSDVDWSDTDMLME